MVLPQKSIWVTRKPSTSKCSQAITGFKPGLSPNKPKKFRPVNQCSVYPNQNKMLEKCPQICHNEKLEQVEPADLR